MHMTSLHLEDAPNFTLFGKYATKWRWSAVVDCARLLCLCILWVHIYVCDGISLQFHHIKWHLDLWLSEHFIESRINYVAEINKKIKHLGFLTHTHTNVLYTINQFSIRYLFVTNLELKENKNKTTINQTTHTHTPLKQKKWLHVMSMQTPSQTGFCNSIILENQPVESIEHWWRQRRQRRQTTITTLASHSI